MTTTVEDLDGRIEAERQRQLRVFGCEVCGHYVGAMRPGDVPALCVLDPGHSGTHLAIEA